MISMHNTVEHQIFDGDRLSLAAVDRAFDILSQTKTDYADIYIQQSLSEYWLLEEGAVKQGAYNTGGGFGVRAVCGEKTAFAYADNGNAEALLKAAQTVRAIGAHGQSARTSIVSYPYHPLLYTCENPISTSGAEDKIALLKRIDEIARAADRRIIDVFASISLEYDLIWIARADGRRHSDIRPLVHLSVTVIMEENARRERGSFGGGGRIALSVLNDEHIQKYIERAVEQAQINLQARSAPAGKMPVVLGSGWPGILLHEAVGHSLEGDINRKQTGIFAGKLGERVAAKGVTVIDQGNIPDRRGSLNIDDEGNPTQRTVLIEDGILKAYLHDETNARLMNTVSTGNGRREDYSSITIPRMTNTFMESGHYEAQEIIESVKCGIYAKNFGGGQVDTTSGQFVFSAAEAWWIENGKLCYPLKGVTLIGNGAQTLKHITMVGNDCQLDSGIGVCGKDGQSVPVGVGLPTVCISEGLAVGGSQVLSENDE